MKTARIAVLGVAVAAGLGAAILAGGSKPPEKTAAPPLPPPAVTDDVLVAAKDLNFGAIVGEADLRWENWPKDHIPEGLVRKSASPSGDKELKGAIVRSNFAAGEPFCGASAWSWVRIPGFLPPSCRRAAARWRSTSTRKVRARLAALFCQTTEST